jgi:flavin reductase (DIM6/NTAB) family NADH-FMN oxidoreductase RutF
MQTDPDTRSPFARFAAGLDYPLYVVTTVAGKEPTGCLVGFATQCSIRPARFLVCLSKSNHTYGLAMQAPVLAVHAIGEGNTAIAELFGGETGDEVDKFKRIGWRLVHGVPVLDECSCWFAGQVLEQIDLGDHVGFVLKPLEAEPGGGEKQMTFQQATAIEPGHAP